MTLTRLQKYLSEAGHCSRRHGENLIRQGHVTVNGETVTVLGTKIDPEKDRVAVDGRPLAVEVQRIYIALNKPPGVVTSCSHPGKKIVLDLIDIPQRVFPVGRLDEDSQGLLLMTNDGPLHHRLSHPSFDHEKEYDVTVAAPLADPALKEMAEGMDLKGKKTRLAKVRRISTTRFRIVLKEGRNRQIRRMVEQTGNRVTRLERIRISGIRLGNLQLGKWRYLSADEIAALLKMP
jgi:23S rRNA pseudouridine2605 synthase/23S rRNA pseudouridine2604 synthase